MKNIKIYNTSGLTSEYYIKYINDKGIFDKYSYLWKSSITGIIYEVKNVTDATCFKSREAALLVAEEFILSTNK